MLTIMDTLIKSNDINTGISVVLYIATLYGFAITNNVMYVPKTTEERKIGVTIFFTTTKKNVTKSRSNSCRAAK